MSSDESMPTTISAKPCSARAESPVPAPTVERTARSGEAAGEQFNDQRVEVGTRRRIAAGHDLPAERFSTQTAGSASCRFTQRWSLMLPTFTW
jgi:hypothetical protein